MAAKDATLYKLEVVLTPTGQVVVRTDTVSIPALRKVLDSEEVEDANAICYLVEEYTRGCKELVNNLEYKGKRV